MTDERAHRSRRLRLAGEDDRPEGEEVSFVRALGHTVRVSRLAGSGDSPPLLLLMGLGANMGMWEPLRTELTARGVGTVAIDVPGTGDSPAPKVPLPLVVHAALVLAVMRQLKIAEFDVMGLSWGGLLAQQIAMVSPHRTRRVVLLSTNVGLGSLLGNWRTTKTLLTRHRYRSAEGMAHAASAFGGDTNHAAQPTHPHTMARLAKPPSKRGYYSQLLSVCGWSSLPFLWLIRQPTLVICGDDDLAVPPINARMLARLIPHAELDLVVGAGHLLAVERPVQTATAVTDFLHSIPSDDADSTLTG